MSRIVLLFGVVWSLAIPVAAQAQSSQRTLISQQDANRLGLTRTWFTRVQLDSSRSRIGFVTQHVSSTKGHRVFEIAYDGGKVVFSERDSDRYGQRLGTEGAEKLANRRLEELQRANRNPTLTQQVIADIVLYTMTDRGVVQAIDGETGQTRWVTQVGNPRFPSEAPGANDNFVAVVNGSGIYVLTENTGDIVWTRQARGTPGAGPAVTNRFVFAPMVSGSIEAYSLVNYRQPPWIFRAHGRAMVQPIFTGANVAWPTDRGHLNVAEGDNTSIRFRLETNGAIVAPAAALSPNRIVVASTDGYVYCLQENSGSILWRFSTGEQIVTAPMVIGDGVYVATYDGSFFRISADLGQEVWWANGITKMLSASENRVYCLSQTRRLTILDQKTGARVGSLPTEGLDLHVANKLTDRIFVGTHAGIIQCLHEVQQEWPLIHLGGQEVEEPSTTPAAPEATPDTPPPAPDPFGSGGSDPFGVGSGGGGGSGASGGSSSSSSGGGGDPFGGGDDPFGDGSF